MKLLNFFSENILFVISIFLLIFIPLYPKLPLLDIQNTWVYVRIEDFLVAFAAIAWIIQYFRKKAVLNTPLTIPIIIFWVVGGLATLFAVIFFFPHMANVQPEIALLHYLRRIEYLLVFFIAASSIKSEDAIKYIVITLSATLFAVCVYGFGQKFLGFPAFLTMNEEFAKGTPLTLSQAGRVASTFAGHYDLAAYLVLMASIMGSLAIGVKKIYLKILFASLVLFSLSLLLLTTSRVSFVVWFLSMIFLLFIRKTKIQKKYFLALPLIILLLLTTSYFNGIIERFSDTFSKAKIVIDLKDGAQLGIADEITSDNGVSRILIEEKQSTGEDLPQGSKYISLPTAKSEKVVGNVTIKRQKLSNGKSKEEVTTKSGSFIIKNVFAYDVSFTTRLQGTWPRAINAFNRNPLSGSGYSSIDVGTDGNYLRILGEVGILGLISFMMIFLVFGVYVNKVLPSVKSTLARNLILGVVAGVFGIALNAVLIDVFEASKIAFTLWLLIGITVGILMFYQDDKFDLFDEVKKVLTSMPAIILYLLLATFAIYLRSLSNYFVGDDFTWLRWSADCIKEMSSNQIYECEPILKTISKFFTEANGFFYRPGTKLYFYISYIVFGLNAAAYHFVSIFIHFINASLIFIISKSLTRSKKLATIIAFIFLTLSSHTETIIWISSINHLFASMFVLLALASFIHWKKNKNILFFIVSLLAVFLSPLFHELGIVAPVILIVYDLIFSTQKLSIKYLRNWYIYPLLIQMPVYLYLRASASSHWMQGDYSYNLFLLPFNFIGNTLGYILTIIFGGSIIPLHQALRLSTKDHLFTTSLIAIIALVLIFYSIKKLSPLLSSNLKIYLFGASLFIIPLLPFLGLGNISLRYTYLSSFGLILLLVVTFSSVFSKHTLLNSQKLKYIFLSVLLFFITFHILSIQTVNTLWRESGNITMNLQKKFNGKVFPKNSILFFVNTPVKNGEAWIFPVGLEDALWFALPNSDHTIRSVSTLTEAFELTSQTPNSYVYEFTSTGDILKKTNK